MSTLCPAVVCTHILSRCIQNAHLRTSAYGYPVGPALLEHLDGALWLCAHAYPLTRRSRGPVQETCLRALRAEAKLQPNSNVKSWFFTILRNSFLKQLRQGPTPAAIFEIEAKETSEAAWRQKRGYDPDTAFLRHWEQQQVQLAVASLPPLVPLGPG